MSVYLTGDTHGDFTRFNYKKNWPGKMLPIKGDVVIVLGDFGLVFSPIFTLEEKKAITNLNKKPWITTFVDGNHENHPRLYNLPEVPLFNGKAGYISNKVYHLKRGEVYSIEGKKFFTFGGAVSIDRYLRIPHVTWWQEEVPSPKEMDYGLQNLENNQNSVSYILSHTAPENIIKNLIKEFRSLYNDLDPTRKYLQHVCENVSFEAFYCGHWHLEWDYNKYHFLYEKIIKLL